MSFFYTYFGDNMKIYLDLIILLNFFLDFLLLVGVSLILRRNTSLLRIIIGALFGGISILFLFIKITSFQLFIFKIIISIIMILISFGYKNMKYTLDNLVYLYLISIILGGFLYYINDELSYKNIGLIFFNNGISINYVFILILSPLIIYIYIKKQKKIKEVYSNYYKVEITLLNNKRLCLTGFLDSGNNLYDPYKKRPIIVLNKNLLKNYNPKYILVPIYTVNSNTMMKCFKIKKLVVNGKNIKEDVLVGLSDNNFKLEDVNILLHKKIIGGNINE